ncbi:hypothetical protein CLOM_g19193 [Closterium sp. NIES-68]|nr:hypothetical protein CLOM_g19193 [Closterium sp. NIES-68]
MASTLARFEKDVKRTDTGFQAIATKVEKDGEKPSGNPQNLKELLNEFQDILPDDLPNELPPYRTHQHEIVEEPGSKPTFRVPYWLSPTELADMKNRSSISSQKDSSDHPLRHTVPQYSSHRNRTEACACASITQLSTSRPSRTNTQSHESMTCLTSFGKPQYFPNWICGPDTRRYEWRTIQSTKLPSELDTGCTTEMNHILRPLLDKCMVVYLDGILIYSRDMQQHVQHIRRVFDILRRERFYVKLSKSKFALEKVQFLGHLVSAQGVRVDPKKIEVVHTWKTPENVKELQQFLGFVNYYKRFVPQYAKIATLLTNLLKKNTPYKWEPKHHEAMEQLKRALKSAHVLILPGPERDYVIEADVSDQAVGAVLIQDQGNGLQPIAYLSQKLYRAELNYRIHDKDALAIIIAFKTWRCYLEGRQTTVYTDHCSLKYLKIQPNLSRRDIAYRNGSTKIWVPNCPPLRQLLLEEYHDVLYARHFGSNKTLTSIAKHYYWLRMAADVQQFLTSCATCQRMKCSKQKKAGLLQPLPVPEQPWHVVSLDFITGLPTTTSGHDAILVVIDKFSKMGHFILTHTTARSEAAAQLFVHHIISQHGIPTTLISDRDPKFTSKFLKELMSLLRTKLPMSSAYHPQTDGQTERLNQIVERLLRAVCKDEISKWDLHLPVLEFAYYNATHAATGQTPFFLCYGRHPLTPHKPTASATIQTAHDFITTMHQLWDRTHKRLLDIQQQQKRQAI